MAPEVFAKLLQNAVETKNAMARALGGENDAQSPSPGT